MSSKYGIIELIKSDLFRYRGKISFPILVSSYFTFPGFRYMFWCRLTKHFKRRNILLFFYCRLRLKHYSFKYGIQIPYSVKVGRGFYIGHFGEIVVSTHAIIGDNVNISQGVTIGNASRGFRKGAAEIKDEVYIGPGAKIVGKVIIGNNVAIGANAVVTKDISNDSVVAGVPAKLISSDGATGYINNKC